VQLGDAAREPRADLGYVRGLEGPGRHDDLTGADDSPVGLEPVAVGVGTQAQDAVVQVDG